MSSGSCGNTDKTVGAFFNRFFGESVIDNVVQADAAVRVYGIEYFRPGTQRSNDHGNFMLNAHLHIMHQPVVRAVNNLIYGERRGGLIGIGGIILGQFCLDASEPLVEFFRRPRVQGGK